MAHRIAFILKCLLEDQLAFLKYKLIKFVNNIHVKDQIAIDMSDHRIRGKTTNITKDTNWILD